MKEQYGYQIFDSIENDKSIIVGVVFEIPAHHKEDLESFLKKSNPYQISQMFRLASPRVKKMRKK